MTMDEVNERFPVTKYKMWRSSREHEGLPAAGGIAQPGAGSRPPSMKEMTDSAETSKPGVDANQSIPTSLPLVDKLDQSSQSQKQASKTPGTAEDANVIGEGTAANATATDAEKAIDRTQKEKSADGAIPEAQPREDGHPESDEEDDDEDDPARAPVQQELLDAPGDTCAICLDNIDDDDDVRGLSCGHAFHAGCLDPWLTSRRACCPLCKADYYIPKTRIEDIVNSDEGQSSPGALSGHRIGVPMTPHGAMVGRVGGGLPFLAFRSRTATTATSPNADGTSAAFQQGERTADVEAARSRRGLGGSFFALAGRLRRNQGDHTTSDVPATSQISPSQSPQSPQITILQPSDTPATPRVAYLTAESTNPADFSTPMTTFNTPITNGATPSSPSPSPNWRTRLLNSTPPSRSRVQAEPSSLSFISRLRRGGRSHDNDSSINANDNANGDATNNDSNLANSDGQTGASGRAGTGTDTAPVLPSPVFGGGVALGDGITPSQLEAGVRA